MPERPVLDLTVAPGDGWIGEVLAGQRLRVVDLEGNQAVDTLVYNARDYADRYSAVDTIVAQRNAYLTVGSRLISTGGNHLMTIVADTCGRHDTLGGACSRESNAVRYGEHTRHMHACRTTFLLYAERWGRGLEKRDLTANMNLFMNVPITSDGELAFADGLSGPGKHVEFEAAMDVLVLISNCPQVNNPCNGWNPTPVRLLVLDPEDAGA